MKKTMQVSLFLLVLCFMIPSLCQAAVWKFVVMADNQDNIMATNTGVNEQVPTLVQYIIAENPDLVVCVGDVISGWNVDKPSSIIGDYDKMYKTWLKDMKPLTDKGIPFYVVRGNHDYGPHNGKYLPKLHDAYKNNIASIMPQSGPIDEAGLTYSFIPSGRKAKFIMMDEFYKEPVGSNNGNVGINTAWLKNELSTNGVASGNFVFVFMHSPAYKVTATGPSYSLFNQQSLRDTFWNLLQQYKTTAYFCGHIHLYCRGVAKGVPQFVVGTGGGAFDSFVPQNADSTLTNVFPTASLPKENCLHGYLVVTVDEENGVISYVQRLITADGQLYTPKDDTSVPQLDNNGPKFPRAGGDATSNNNR